MKNLVSAVLAASVVMVAAGAAAHAPRSAAYATDYDAARARAKADARNLLVLFTGSDWCRWCRKLEKEVLSKPAFLEFATNEYEYVVLDFPRGPSSLTEAELQRNEMLKEKLGVMGFPTLVVVDAASEEGLFSMGYEEGGARKWVALFKKNLQLEPLKRQYLDPVWREVSTMAMSMQKELDEIGVPTDANKAVQIKAVFARALENDAKFKARLTALELPQELADFKRQFLEIIEEHEARCAKIASMDVAELIARPRR